MSHAVRIARQAVEFLHTGQVTFPRPEAAHLLAIKLGQVSYKAVGTEIEELLNKVEAAAIHSDLPENSDPGIADDFVASLYNRIVRGEAL